MSVATRRVSRKAFSPKVSPSKCDGRLFCCQVRLELNACRISLQYVILVWPEIPYGRNNSVKWEFHPDRVISCLSTRRQCLSRICAFNAKRPTDLLSKEKEKGTFYLGKVVELCCFFKQSFIFCHGSNFVDNRLCVTSKLIYDSRLTRQIIEGEEERGVHRAVILNTEKQLGSESYFHWKCLPWAMHICHQLDFGFLEDVRSY